MKLNPYAVLVTTSALMLAIVLAQVSTGITLLKEGASSIDRDVAGLAGRTWTSLTAANESRALPQVAETTPAAKTLPNEASVAAETRVAAVDRGSADTHD